MKGRTEYIKKSRRNLDDLNVPSAGPRPSIRGMREKFWGFDVDVAIQSAYAYNVGVGGLDKL